MIDVTAFEALCLACSDTTAVPHVDRVAFRTTRKIFATLAPDGQTVNLCLAPEQQALLCRAAPRAFAPVAGGWGRMGWTTVRFVDVDASLCRTAVGGAHLHALPPTQRARGVAYVRFAVVEPGYFRLLARPEIVAASEHLRHANEAQQALMEPVPGRHQQGLVSAELAQRSAGMLAAQALTYGLARMITDGLLGDVSADDAERLAHELTGVLGEGLARTERGSP